MCTQFCLAIFITIFVITLWLIIVELQKITSKEDEEMKITQGGYFGFQGWANEQSLKSYKKSKR